MGLWVRRQQHLPLVVGHAVCIEMCLYATLDFHNSPEVVQLAASLSATRAHACGGGIKEKKNEFCCSFVEFSRNRVSCGLFNGKSMISPSEITKVEDTYFYGDGI